MRALVVAFLVPTAAPAADIAAITAAVMDLCNLGTSTSGSSSRLEVTGEADGDMRIRLIGKAGVAGDFTMTKEEWEGIQQVVREDQLADNEGRRACVRDLTPQFLSSAE